MFIQRILLEGDLEQTTPMGVVACLEMIEGLGDEKFNAGNGDGWVHSADRAAASSLAASASAGALASAAALAAASAFA